jgi:hypothetical protein
MQTVICPHCHQTIDLDEAQEHEFRAKLEESLQKQERQLKVELWNKAQAEAKKRADETQRAAQEAQQKQFDELQERLKTEEEKRKSAEENELKLLKKQREVEEKEKHLELKIERELAERMKTELEKSSKIEEERFRLKELEYQKQLNDMRVAVEEARRKATTVSQQLQGEVLELELEKMLSEAFPHDQITEVKKGQFGADMLHIVRTNTGKQVGIIVWESKQTERFSDGWLPKLREDARNAHGSVAVLVSRSLPEGIKTCAERDHVWITSVDFVLPLAVLLRQQLLKVDQERTVQSGKEVKSEMLYSYINSHEFRGRVEAIVESFVEMKDDLDREQRQLQLSWKKREKQILRLATNTAFMYGELQGVVGASLPDISGLALESGNE